MSENPDQKNIIIYIVVAIVVGLLFLLFIWFFWWRHLKQRKSCKSILENINKRNSEFVYTYERNMNKKNIFTPQIVADMKKDIEAASIAALGPRCKEYKELIQNIK